MKPGTTRLEEAPAQTTPAHAKLSWQGLLYVCVAVFFFSTSAVFVRLAEPFSAIEIAFWRLVIAALLVALLGLFTRQRLLLRRREVPRFVFYGLITALHFFFYVAALSFTTIAHALAIVYASPIFVAIFSALVLREPLPLRKYIGIGVAVGGIAIMELFGGSAQIAAGESWLLGDGLALLSAICYAIYTIAGRGERERHPLFRYTTNVYGLAALWLLPLALLLAFRHSYPLPAIGAVLALGIFPLGLGHTLYNASVRHVHATYANLIATQEVTGGIILGILWLHEIPSATTLIGVLVTLAGIVSVLI